eukprot:TRINITY_DN104365_c0_g1_i1.p1 TRINITY_DN104365_c0_g1~~TRINITY_DN104365_c0_g1_i1.p1  ORF type:complete len:806 (+),score=142.31 TRINITY_DN104365_c0_g1_i1:62-2479(+)
MGCGSSAKYNVGASSQEDGVPDSEHQEVCNILQGIALFQHLPSGLLAAFAKAFEVQEFEPGATVVKAGDVEGKFLIVRKGEASVGIVDDETGMQKVDVLMPGDYFGLKSLLSDKPRKAAILAESALTILGITRVKFMELGLHEHVLNSRRRAVKRNVREIQVQEPSPKTAEERALIADALRGNARLRAMVNLDDAHIDAMIEVCWKQTIPNNCKVIEAGGMGDYFYVIQEGEFEISRAQDYSIARAWVEQKHDATEQKSDSTENLKKPPSRPSWNSTSSSTVISKGHCFGELALLLATPRTATVRAVCDSVVWVFDRTNFKRILMKSSAAVIDKYVETISKIELLASLSTEHARKIAETLTEIKFSKDDVIFEQNEIGVAFYILCDGEVAFIEDGVERHRLSACNSEQFFGEQALLTGDKRAATVVVTSASARALVIDLDSFTELLGPVEQILNQSPSYESVKQRLGYSHTDGQFQSAASSWKPSGRKKEDLTKLRRLGTGAFSVVDLYMHTPTHTYYALKAMSKKHIEMRSMQECALQEKRLMLMIDSPFTIHICETYNSSEKLYFLMEAALGGELWDIYSTKGLHGSERHAKFFVAGVLLGIEHLHARKIIYRDLKTENILLNEKGYTQLSDLGLAKYVIGRTFTVCGTPEYFAPEILAHSGYTHAVDWWALGIFTFELMAERTPFESPSQIEMFQLIAAGINQAVFPEVCGEHVKSFICALLQNDPSDRLPMKMGKSQNLQNHVWYGGFHWESLKDQSMEAPYAPKIDYEALASKRMPRDNMLMEGTYVPDSSAWDADFATS